MRGQCLGKKKRFGRSRWLRHLGGKPALFHTKLPGAAVSAQPRPSQALSGACCARHMQDPNQTYSWQRYSFQRQACQGCPDTGRKSAQALGVPSQEDSSWKVREIISGGSLEAKIWSLRLGQGKGQSGVILWFLSLCSVTAECNLNAEQLFHEAGHLLSLSTNVSLKTK